jgi:hypothetical protein
MEIEKQIADISGQGVVEIPFQNPRSELFFSALEEDNMMILSGKPIRVHGVEYDQTGDVLLFEIERVNPLFEVQNKGA